MNENVYTVTGWQFGRFKTREGDQRNYANIFVLEPFNGEMSSDRSYTGVKAAGYRVADKELLRDVKPHDKVELYFDRYKRVSKIMIVESAPTK